MGCNYLSLPEIPASGTEVLKYRLGDPLAQRSRLMRFFCGMVSDDSARWRQDMKTLFALLALWEGNPPVNDGLPSQRASNGSSDGYVGSLTKLVNCCYFGSWRSRDDTVITDVNQVHRNWELVPVKRPENWLINSTNPPWFVCREGQIKEKSRSCFTDVFYVHVNLTFAVMQTDCHLPASIMPLLMANAIYHHTS